VRLERQRADLVDARDHERAVAGHDAEAEGFADTVGRLHRVEARDDERLVRLCRQVAGHQEVPGKARADVHHVAHDAQVGELAVGGYHRQVGVALPQSEPGEQPRVLVQAGIQHGPVGDRQRSDQHQLHDGAVLVGHQVEVGPRRVAMGARRLEIVERAARDVASARGPRCQPSATASIRPDASNTRPVIPAEAGLAKDTGDNLKLCLESERRTREQLSKDWSTFPVADRARCVKMQTFSPTFSELATCLEMNRDLRNAGPINSVPQRK